jgi:hypothetical protein
MTREGVEQFPLARRGHGCSVRARDGGRGEGPSKSWFAEGGLVLAALLIWMLGKFGVAPTPEDLARYEREFQERGHHIGFDFGGTRYGGTRWTDDNFRKYFTAGMNYEYLVDRPYHGVALEALAQSLGPIFEGGYHEFYVAGGLGYFPIRSVHLFMSGGSLIDTEGEVRAAGRVGAGYRFNVFMIAVQPLAFVQTDTDGRFSWGMHFRIQY